MIVFMIKYIVFPGYIDSSNDKQTHYISSNELMLLYKVRPEECIVFNPKDKTHKMKQFIDGLIELRPRYDGEYSL